ESYQTTATRQRVNRSRHDTGQKEQDIGFHGSGSRQFLIYIQGNASRSTLPPVRIIPTRFLPMSIFDSAMPAYGTAADGSVTIFIVSQIVRMAEIIAS